MICTAYMMIRYATCKNWYKKIHDRDFDLKDPRSERIVKLESDEMQMLLNQNTAQTQKELAEQLRISQKAISDHLHQIGKIRKKGIVNVCSMNCD